MQIAIDIEGQDIPGQRTEREQDKENAKTENKARTETNLTDISNFYRGCSSISKIDNLIIS
jgi:hypothetical protein